MKIETKGAQGALLAFTGMSGAGKSTTGKEMSRRVDKVVYLDRDPGMWAMLHVALDQFPNLPSFSKYVGEDGLFPDHVREVKTFMGPVLKLTDRTQFYKRHVSKQSYLVLAAYAAEFLKAGKVVIVEPFLQRMIEDGTLKMFLGLEDFVETPKGVVHFIADMDTLFERHQNRAKTYSEDEKLARQMFSLTDRAAFEAEMRKTHSGEPQGLDQVPHIILDTTTLSVSDCVEKCLSYVKVM